MNGSKVDMQTIAGLLPPTVDKQARGRITNHGVRKLARPEVNSACSALTARPPSRMGAAQ